MAGSRAQLATYRLQLRVGLDFQGASALVEHLADLGVSHLYLSPVLQATPGSTHGYDVVDHSNIDEALGGREAFDALASRAREAGIGLMVDIVPNHMAIDGRLNRWWWDVLEDGPASPFARFFDVDWDPPEQKLKSAVLVPVLGQQYGRALEAGEIVLRREGGSFVISYFEHELPISPRSLDGLLAAAAAPAGSDELASLATAFGRLPPATATEREAVAERHRDEEVLRARLASLCDSDPRTARAIDSEVGRINDDPDLLDDLLSRQNHRLAHWRTASDELDYRRFFDIDTLIGLRIEDPEVFDLVHEVALGSVRTGQVDGLRIDHIDGLRDPLGYLRRLRDAVGDARLVVEKILAHDEVLPATWPIEGTTGYDLLNRINGIYVESANEAAMDAVHREITGDSRPYSDVVREAKLHVLDKELAAELERLTSLLAEVCERHRRHRDHTRRELRDVLRELLVAMRVYRTYVRLGDPTSAADEARVAEALVAVRSTRPDLDDELVSFVGDLLLLRRQGAPEAELALRFGQVAGPVMAKGLEDTAFYRYTRLVSLNEVGGDPGRFGSSVEELHDANARTARLWPSTMTALSTHDTKRGSDVRARISVLSEIPEQWGTSAARWMAMLQPYLTDAMPDRSTAYLMLQTLIGAWPIDAERLAAYMSKAAREAKVHTSWTDPDDAYEAALDRFVRASLADPDLLADVQAFLGEWKVVEHGRTTSLSQATILLTSPGVPDIYQGSELWDLVLVDPDNRRPVDHEARAALLAELRGAGPREALDHMDDGGVKLWLVHRLLQHRRARPGLYEGAHYEPVVASGSRSRHAVCFQRGSLLVVAPRLVASLAGDWADTRIALPPGSWRHVLADEAPIDGDIALEDLLRAFPVAVLERQEV